MKEAAGEANMTVVTIILIGVIVAVVTPIINKLMTTTSKRSECMNKGVCYCDDIGDCCDCE